MEQAEGIYPARDRVHCRPQLPPRHTTGDAVGRVEERLLSIDKLVLVKFLNDTVVVPRDSEWFGFYVDGQDQLVAPLEQSALYTEDWLGLKTLNDQGRLVLLSCLGNHLQMPAGFFTQHILPWLTPAKGAHSDPSMTGARKTI